MQEYTDKTYIPEEGEEVLEFIRRVIAEQPRREPLHIVEQLVEIAMNELKDRPCQLSAWVSEQCMKMTLHHKGRPIDDRMVRLMGDHTDRVDYHPSDNDS